MKKTDEKISAGKVGLLITCLVDLFRPSVAAASVQLLQKYGAQVSVPQQSCCGQPAYNSGDNDKAATLAKNFITEFEQFDYIVAPSGSCVAMVKLHYPELLKNDSQWQTRAQRVADKTWELSQFLVDVLQVKLSGGESCAQKITYHDSCSGLRELGIRSQPRTLLQGLRDITIHEMNNAEICCGFGGTFCVKYPQISGKMVDDKINGIPPQCDAVIGGDLGCLMNIAGRLQRTGGAVQVFHYAELLADQPPDRGIAE